MKVTWKKKLLVSIRMLFHKPEELWLSISVICSRYQFSASSSFKMVCSSYNLHSFISFFLLIILLSSADEQFGVIPDKIATLCLSLHICSRLLRLCNESIRMWLLQMSELQNWGKEHDFWTFCYCSEFWLAEVKLISFWFWFTVVFPCRVRRIQCWARMHLMTWLGKF